MFFSVPVAECSERSEECTEATEAPGMELIYRGSEDLVSTVISNVVRNLDFSVVSSFEMTGTSSFEQLSTKHFPLTNFQLSTQVTEPAEV